MRPHPASVDRGGGQSAGAHLLPVQPWSQGSALGTDPTGGAPAPSTKAGHQALGLRLTQMLSQQFRTHCGPDSWFTRCSGTSPWPPSLARWQALGQGVSTGASWAALHAGSMDVSLSELREMVMDKEAWRAVIHGFAKSRTRDRKSTRLNSSHKHRSRMPSSA